MLFATIAWGVSGCHQPASNEEKALRIAFIGDAEPKPLAEFPNMAEAVHRINQMHGEHPFDLVIGVGDIAHKGTLVQYEAATAVLTQLQPPFYPIMGNEEHDQSTERYLSYISKWNSPADTTKYTLEYDHVALIFASPDFGRDFSDEGAGWILEELRRIAPKPALLIVHAAQAGAYPENPEKGVMNERFRNEVITQPNLSAVISGDLHMDMDRVQHSKKIGPVHYLHIPALERTKIPDETHHRPMVRVMTIQASGAAAVDTYALDTPEAPLPEHAYTFQLQPAASPSPQ